MLKGKGISNGIGIGKAIVIKKEKIEIEKRNIQNVEEELKKLDVALDSIIKETQDSIEKLEKEENNEQSQIMQAYLMILQDETLIEKAKILIEEEKLNSVYATKKGVDEIITNFKNIDNEYLAERPKVDVKYSSKDALFLSEQKRRISNRTVQHIVKLELKKSGLDINKYSTHKLRHTAATLMYKYGNVDIRALQELLGHESISTTEIYTHVDNDQIRSAVENNPLANM